MPVRVKRVGVKMRERRDQQGREPKREANLNLPKNAQKKADICNM